MARAIKTITAVGGLWVGLLFLLPPMLFSAAPAAALENQFNADLQLNGTAVRYAEDSWYDIHGPGSGYDGQAALRLKERLFFSDNMLAELHYEISFTGGETYKKNYRLTEDFSEPTGLPSAGSVISDDRRLFDLTASIEETPDYALSHRLDRMLIAITPDWGEVTVGRQAVTWGNGLLFNPMDLFNPFAPADTIRDYKIGDDLLSLRFNTESYGEFNFLLVPRRNDENDVDEAYSSAAGKTHLFIGAAELDLMLARHYEEVVAGVGISGYIGGATCRGDAVWSTLTDTDEKSGFLNLVLNLDYSWVLAGKNMYGLVEYFHSGLGKEDYGAAMLDSEVIKRLERGELFTLGNDYLAGQIQIELHPLFNFYLNAINNISDPSGIIQPRGVWSFSQKATLTAGLTTCYGKKGTEFGGVAVPGPELTGVKVFTTSPESIYLLLSCYF